VLSIVLAGTIAPAILSSARQFVLPSAGRLAIKCLPYAKVAVTAAASVLAREAAEITADKVHVWAKKRK
jgi:hypothetical protein